MTMMNRTGRSKKLLVIIALTIIAIVAAAILSQTDDISVAGDGKANLNSDEPSFEIKLKKPWSARPLGGLFGLIPQDDLGFDDDSPEAEVVVMTLRKIEWKAADWQLVIETDEDGRIEPTSFLMVRMELAGKIQHLRCRPADPVIGNLEIADRHGAELLTGKIHLELETCERVETGREVNWPPAPLTLRGRFHRQPVKLEEVD